MTNFRRSRIARWTMALVVLLALHSPVAAQVDSTRKDSAVERTSSSDKTPASVGNAHGEIAAPGKLRVTPEIEERYANWARFAFLAMVAWILGVIAYLVWAIRFYVGNYGLSDHEWKVLHPEIYAKENELEKYKAIRSRLATRVASGEESDDASGSGASSAAASLTAPEANPYQAESFGLPPGTIRGILALTAMVAFVLIECVNLLSPTNLEIPFKELVTVFQMVVAFYFGAKAIDIFNRRADVASQEKTQLEVAASNPPPTEAATRPISAPDSKIAAPTAPPQQGLPAPADLPILRPSTSELRKEGLEAHPIEPDTAPAGAPGPSSHLNVQTPLATRVLALTAHFETGRGFPDCFAGISGDFDKQGLSFGALQWCIGQNSLQPLLLRAIREGGDAVRTALGDDKLHTLNEILTRPLPQQMEWARSIQYSRQNSAGKRIMIIEASWKNALVALGRTDTMIRIETDQAAVRYQKALANCQRYGCTTERAVALFFDINVQNGSVDPDNSGVGSRILADTAKLAKDMYPIAREVEILKIVARRRSAICKPEWRADVLSRKMAIAEGSGVVHQSRIDLAAQYFIRLEKADA